MLDAFGNVCHYAKQQVEELQMRIITGTQAGQLGCYFLVFTFGKEWAESPLQF